jgi:hypothetical protein
MDIFISDPSAPWTEKRSFFTTLTLNSDAHTNAFIDQTVIWYAQTEAAAAVWNGLNPETYNGQQLVERNGDPARPASMLFCLSEGPPAPGNCTYLAYWGHWYTEVTFWSQYDEDLQLPEMQRIGRRVDQLLLSASVEPCYGSLCTSALENKNR